MHSSKMCNCFAKFSSNSSFPLHRSNKEYLKCNEFINGEDEQDKGKENDKEEHNTGDSFDEGFA
jgi:hypothetical protein